MPTYPTMPVNSKPMQNQGTAWLALKVSNVDFFLWNQKTAGNPTGKMTGSIVRPDNTAVTLAEGEIVLLDAAAETVKILLAASTLTLVGNYKVFAKFKFDDGWIAAEPVQFTVVDDPTQG